MKTPLDSKARGMRAFAFRTCDRHSGQDPLSDHGMVAWRPHAMKQKPRYRADHKNAKIVLRLPDFEFAKVAVYRRM
jgi:hypothetical protein